MRPPRGSAREVIPRRTLAAFVKVSTLFFDFGGTLARSWITDGRHPSEFWARALERNGIPVDLEAVRTALDATARELDGRIYDYLGRTPEFWRLLDHRVMDRLGIVRRREGLTEELERDFLQASTGELYPETLATLNALQDRNIPLGIISNHNDGLRGILAYHGVARFFRTVTYSQEVGAEKPDRRIFDLALGRARCDPAEAVHVGDSWEADVVGATRVGMRAVWLNRRHVAPPRPCEHIGDLQGVIPLLSP